MSPTVPSSPSRRRASSAISSTQSKMAGLCKEAGLKDFELRQVPSDFYDQSLEWRKNVLEIPSTDQLCKTLIMENVKLNHVDEEAAKKRLRYVAVVVQYGQKLHKEKLGFAVRRIETERMGLPAAGRKAFNMRMVEPEVSQKLSGFTHNAVTCVGMATKMPVIISDRIIDELPYEDFWLGGGHIDLKLRMCKEEFLSVFDPVVADITV